MNKIISTLRRSIVVGIGIFVGIVLYDGIGDDAIYSSFLFVYAGQNLGLLGYVVVCIIIPHMTGGSAPDDKRILYSSVAMICSISLSIHYYYIYGFLVFPRGLIVTTLLSFWEFMWAENLYSYDKKWMPILHNTLSLQFISLLLASCLPIGLYVCRNFFGKNARGSVSIFL